MPKFLAWEFGCYAEHVGYQSDVCPAEHHHQQGLYWRGRADYRRGMDEALAAAELCQRRVSDAMQSIQQEAIALLSHLEEFRRERQAVAC